MEAVDEAKDAPHEELVVCVGKLVAAELCPLVGVHKVVAQLVVRHWVISIRVCNHGIVH